MRPPFSLDLPVYQLSVCAQAPRGKGRLRSRPSSRRTSESAQRQKTAATMRVHTAVRRAYGPPLMTRRTCTRLQAQCSSPTRAHHCARRRRDLQEARHSRRSVPSFISRTLFECSHRCATLRRRDQEGYSPQGDLFCHQRWQHLDHRILSTPHVAHVCECLLFQRRAFTRVLFCPAQTDVQSRRRRRTMTRRRPCASTRKNRSTCLSALIRACCCDLVPLASSRARRPRSTH